MVRYKKGDLFKAQEDILAHGCNCVGGFGSGVAGQMKKFHPNAEKAYLEKHRDTGWTLGDVRFVESNSKWIANCATQEQYYPRNKVHADYPAIRKAMTDVKLFAQEGSLSIAIPKIGAGLAGGDWNVIEKILEEVFSDYDVTVYEL